MQKKSIWARATTLVVTLAIMLGCVPNVFAAEVSSVIEYRDTKVNTTLRAEPYESSAVVENIGKGTTIAVFETVENRYHNQWIKTRINGQDGYVFSGKLRSHEHRHNMSVKEGNTLAKICPCGSVQVCHKSNRLIPFLSISTTADTFMSPAVWDTVAALGSTVTAAGTALVAVGPYAAAAVVIVVAGVALYAVIDVDGTVDEVYGKDTALEKFKEFNSETEPYQLASTFTSSGSKSTNGLIIIPGTSMTLEEATNVACYKTSTRFIGLPPADLDPAVKSIITLYRDYDIYTLNPSDATTLAQNFMQRGAMYGYGNSKGLPVAEMDGLSNNSPKDNYYCHYHLFYFSNFIRNKVLHCFYGLPYPMTELANGQCPTA